MIKPAYEYNAEIIAQLHNMPFEHYTEYIGNRVGLIARNIKPNTDTYQSWAFLDINNKVIGYIYYTVKNNAAHVIHMINFTDDTMTVAHGLLEIFRKIFIEQELNSFTWSCYKDHPLKPSYKKLCEAFLGTIQVTNNMIYYTITSKQVTRAYKGFNNDTNK